jgi:hypothetical protein
MTESLGGWSPTGIVAGICMTLGILLLVVYAAQRGLVDRELDGTDEEAAAMAADDPTAPRKPAPRRARRSLGTVGALLLVAGLALGALTALGAWGSNGPEATGPGGAPADCAQGWNGCPKATR